MTASSLKHNCLCVFQPKQERFVSSFLLTTLKTEASNYFCTAGKYYNDSVTMDQPTTQMGDESKWKTQLCVAM